VIRFAAIVLTEAELATVQRLAQQLRRQRTAIVISSFYADPSVQQAIASRDPEARERVAYMSGLVVAEAAIIRRAA
jgi:hypothetical protein